MSAKGNQKVRKEQREARAPREGLEKGRGGGEQVTVPWAIFPQVQVRGRNKETKKKGSLLAVVGERGREGRGGGGGGENSRRRWQSWAP